jgi:hypothetical protein
MTRKGDWMQTFTGRAYWPLDPRAEDVCIEDIAHSLAMQCRYAGHSLRRYSVAEHSVHASTLVPPEHALVALLHDATEAYCVDVPRPLKRNLAGYAEIEHANWLAICERFGLEPEMPQCVHDADIAMLFCEQRQVMRPSPRPDWGMGLTTPIVADIKVGCWSPARAKAQFLAQFDRLTARKRATSPAIARMV